jgi:hypothetical protein
MPASFPGASPGEALVDGFLATEGEIASPAAAKYFLFSPPWIIKKNITC